MTRVIKHFYALTLILALWSASAFGAGGAISLSSASCNLAGGTLCTLTASWTVYNYSGAGYSTACVWVMTLSPPGLVGCGGATGSTPAMNWITGTGAELQLRGHVAPLHNPVTQADFDSGVFLAGKVAFGTGVFGDVSTSIPGIDQALVDAVEALYRVGITAGCGGSPPAASFNFCPTQNVNRLQMATFLERGIHGRVNGVTYAVPTSGPYAPPNPAYADLPSGDPLIAHAWLAISDGIMPSPPAGCAAGNWCASGNVTRAEMARFVLRARYGGTYTPPAATGAASFSDVPIGHPDRDWVEQIKKEGITLGCGGGLYCPTTPVTRAQMALFLTRLFYVPNGNQTQKFFGYFASGSVSAAETSRHSNLFMTAGFWEWCDQSGIDYLVNEAVTRLKDARSRGVASAMLDIGFLVYKSPQSGSNPYCHERISTYGPRPVTEQITNLTAYFDRLRNEGLLPMVLAAYPIDEPNAPGNELTDGQQTGVNGNIRAVAAKYSAIPNLKLAVTYSWDVGNFKARDSYDWQGYDNYGAGAGIFNGDFQNFANGLRADQRAIIIPGGSFGQSPFPEFMNQMNSDPRIAWMMPFFWGDIGVSGIRDLPAMRLAYCQAGSQIKGVDASPCPN